MGIAPVVDLNGAGSGTSTSIAYTEGDLLTAIAPTGTVTDADTSFLAGAVLTVAFTANADPNDRLALFDQGTQVGQITINDPAIYYNFGNLDENGDPLGPELIGNFSGGTNGGALVITFEANVTPAIAELVLRAIGYSNTSSSPSGEARTLSFTLSDGEGNISTPATATINVTLVPDTLVVNDDSFFTDENVAVAGNLFSDNGNGNDYDPLGGALAITAINGSAAAVGSTITLPSGATLTVNSDGSFLYDPDGVFNSLVPVDSGAANFQATDSFTYTVNGSEVATSTINLNGVVSPGDRYRGDSDDNIITGTSQADFFELQQGGNDSAFGDAGNDVFLLGAAMTSADAVDGGAGADQIAIQGNYAGGGALTLGSGVIAFESIAILPGNDTLFGDPGTNFYDYQLTTLDVNVAAGVQVVIDANRLRVGEDFTFNGSAETDGGFFIWGGGGVDTLTGGTQTDIFYFGENGQFGASDTINGGAGSDQLGLRGNYTITFGAGQLTGIESIGMVSAHDTRYGPLGSTFNYNLTMHDGNVAAGVLMTVDAAALRNETLTFNGTAETDGRFRVFGGQGNDLIAGSHGDDIFQGNFGADYITGGDGADTFRYAAVSDSMVDGGFRDRLFYFAAGTDKIDLSRMDASTLAGGDQAFTWIGTSPFSGQGAASAGELHYFFDNGYWWVTGDTDGNGFADFAITLTLDGATPLGQTDFVL